MARVRWRAGLSAQSSQELAAVAKVEVMVAVREVAAAPDVTAAAREAASVVVAAAAALVVVGVDAAAYPRRWCSL